MVQRKIQQLQLDPTISLGGGGVNPGDGLVFSGSPQQLDVDSTVLRTSGDQTRTGDTLTFTGGSPAPVVLDKGTDGFQIGYIDNGGIQETAFIPRNGSGFDDAYSFSFARNTLNPLASEWLFRANVRTQDAFIGSTSGASAPPYTFFADTDTGMFRATTNTLGFSTAGFERLRIESDGTLQVRTTSPAYETLVTNDDDIPNKKYVDDAISVISGTGNLPSFTGTSTITGLTPLKRYLVHVYGVTRNAGSGGPIVLGSVQVRQGTSVGSGTILDSTATQAINWPDGNVPQSATLLVSTPPGVTSINGVVDYKTSPVEFENALAMRAVEIADISGAITGDINISNATYFDSTGGFGSHRVTASFLNDGRLRITRFAAGTTTDVTNQWHVDEPSAANASDYEILVTVFSGSLSAGSSPTNSWISLNTNPSWNKEASSIQQAIIDVSIRDTTNLVVQDTARLTLRVEPGF